jgi:hypothetical protein
MLWKISCTIALACIANGAYAAGLPINDLNPLLSGYDLPALMPSSYESTQSLEVNFNLSNISLDQQSASEHAIADAELRRWQINYNRTINKQWSLRAELPYQNISGGSLDGFIEHFHSTFNLPGGNRKEWPRDRLLVDYSHNATHYHLDSAQSGLGDIALRAGWLFDNNQSHSTSLWFGLKLPTGNADHLIGSGSVDANVTLAATQIINDDLQVFEQASVSLLGTGSRMKHEQKHVVGSGVAGASWALTSKLDVLTQLQMHTAVFESQLKMLGTSTQFSIGPRYHTKSWQASLSITEDIVPDSAPDVQFQFDLSHRF